TTESFTDSVWALPIFPPTWSLVSTNSDVSNSYSWVGKGGKLAIAEMSFDTLGAPKIFKWTELPGIGVGIEESNVANFEFYPNPCGDAITVSVDVEQLGQAYAVYNPLGKQVLEGTLFSEHFTINVDELSPGNYTFRIGTKYCRFIKS
ncbi:MAG: T9SS type A sorting domain-containing protein, partial [Bacteroidota bacterium]